MRGVDSAEIFAQNIAAKFDEGSGHFDSGGATSDDDEVKQAGFRLGRAVIFRLFKSEENIRSDPVGVLE